MFRHTFSLWGLAVTVASLSMLAHAQTYYVGTCKLGKKTVTYNTIQEAVSNVPSGSTVNVCPGTYPEQITITQPLSLIGVDSGANASVVVSAPAGGLVALGSGAYAPQLAVMDSSGPVNISGITIDGTGGSAPAPAVPISILYDSSSGVVNDVVLLSAPTGVVILDDNSASPAVTIENSLISVAAAANADIGIADFGSTISLNARNNYISGFGTFGINANGGTDTVTGNTINFVTVAIGINSASSVQSEVSGNTIINAYEGIEIASLPTNGTSVINNILMNGYLGVDMPFPATLKGNVISSRLSGFGMNLECKTPVVFSGNTFLGSGVALQQVPNGTPLGGGKYFGVPIIEQLCP